LALAPNASTIGRAAFAFAPAMHRLLKPADYVRMPWKDGGGHTTEIAAYPATATLDSFDWRVSIADVAAEGPFSRFPGVDRIIVLIAGAGMRLAGDAHDAELRAPFEPYAFSGDDALSCSLVDGPVRDFNLMLRRGRTQGRVVVVRDAAARIAPARWRVCHAVAGAIECLVPGHPPLAVAPDDTVVFDDEGEAAGGSLAVNPLSAGAVALVAVIEPVT
jgi:environmental stress-induced protein Ves